jgi:hypothetical protein
MSIATGLLILTGNGFAYSMGKINHDLLLAAIPLVMAFSNWGSAWSLDAVTGKTRKPEGLARRPAGPDAGIHDVHRRFSETDWVDGSTSTPMQPTDISSSITS